MKVMSDEQLGLKFTRIRRRRCQNSPSERRMSSAL